MDIFEELIGIKVVEFTNGKPDVFNVFRVITDYQGHPLILESMDGTLYNWINVLSVKDR